MIAIVDYGLGNIRAFYNLYKRLGIDCCLASTEKELRKAQKIVLPGVGSFDHAIETLNNSGLRQPLDQLVLDEKIPVLGVCVGMQMMANSSEEGTLPGLGWIPGEVVRFDQKQDNAAQDLPLPHMGWNTLFINTKIPLLEGFEEDPQFYFLHSYYFKCKGESISLARAHYSCDFTSLASHCNAYGIQCHPEKSHHNGVHLLKNFAFM